MLNSIRINHARIKFRDHVATVMYERVKCVFIDLNICHSMIVDSEQLDNDLLPTHTLKYGRVSF